MPNHVTHRVVVTGPKDAVERFRTECIVDVGDEVQSGSKPREYLDFNVLIPMPEELEHTRSGSLGSIGHAAWYGDPSDILEYPWVKEAGVTDVEELRAFLLKRDPKCKIEADHYESNLRKFGAPTWYEWSIKNWGTKWNSYDLEICAKEDGRLEFRFETAWSPPVPVFIAAAEKYPELTFLVKSFDEGWNFACAGDFHGEDVTYAEVTPTKELQKEVYGHSSSEEE